MSPTAFPTSSRSPRRSALPSNRLLLGFATALALAVAGCGGGSEERALFVLLTDNRLLRISETGEVLSRARLGPAPKSASYGSLLAASPEGDVYALVRGTRQRVVELDASGALVAEHALPAAASWRRLAVGPRTGRLYLVGDVAGTRKNDLGAVELGVRLLVLDPRGQQLSLTPIREPDGRDWYAGWITVAPDESSLLVAYHGTDTTGADLVRLDPIRTCIDVTPAWGACLARNHGRAEWVGGRILAAAESRLALLEPSGRVARMLDARLPDVHLMEFRLFDGAAYAFADCVKGTGLARVDLERGASKPIRACGDTATFLDDSTLVLGRRWRQNPYGPGIEPTLLFVDLEARRATRSIVLPADPADVLAVG